MCITNIVKYLESITTAHGWFSILSNMGLANFSVQGQRVNIFKLWVEGSLLQLPTSVTIAQKLLWLIFKQMAMGRIGWLVCQTVKYLNKHRMGWEEKSLSIGV